LSYASKTNHYYKPYSAPTVCTSLSYASKTNHYSKPY